MWFTVADGVLSDVYCSVSLFVGKYVVTDGATFTDLQTRDMT